MMQSVWGSFLLGGKPGYFSSLTPVYITSTKTVFSVLLNNAVKRQFLAGDTAELHDNTGRLGRPASGNRRGQGEARAGGREKFSHPAER